jgi:hypothetical protein
MAAFASVCLSVSVSSVYFGVFVEYVLGSFFFYCDKSVKEVDSELRCSEGKELGDSDEI